MTNTENPKFKRTVETQMILSRLLDLEKGGLGVSIDELAELVGDPNLYRHRRHIIASARFLAEDLGDMNLEWKDGQIRALSDLETATLGYVRKIRKTVERSMLKSSRIDDFDSLSYDDKVALTCSRTIMSMIKAQTEHKTLKRLEQKIQRSGQKLELDVQLKEFLK